VGRTKRLKATQKICGKRIKTYERLERPQSPFFTMFCPLRRQKAKKAKPPKTTTSFFAFVYMRYLSLYLSPKES
jgi:hypothetical protein